MNNHDATHIIDDKCCAIIVACREMLGACYQIGADGELNSIVHAAETLHARACVAHESDIAGKETS